MRIKNSILIPGLIYGFVLLVLLVLILFMRNSKDSTILLLTGLAIGVVIVGIVYFTFFIYSPLKRSRRRIESLSKSEIVPPVGLGTYHEFKAIDDAIDRHIERIEEIANVTDQLARGESGDDFQAQGIHDVLGQSVLKIKQSILDANKAAVQRRSLDEQQNWASQGIAKFGELLRDFENHVGEKSDLFVKELVHYLGFEVGGLFLSASDDDGKEFFKLTGMYAFDRNKQVKKTFKPGEGLVGRCAIEKQSIIMTKIPEDYIKIRSGMGEDLPATLLLIPVLLDDKVLGIIELATFSIVKNYKIRFLEDLGKSIASSILKAV